MRSATATAALPGGAGRPSPGSLVLASSVFALALAVALPAIYGLSYLFLRVEFYGHGYLLPLVAAYVLYGNRRALRQALADARPPAWGPLVTFAAGAFEVLMLVGDVGFAAGLGIPIVFGAAAYAIGGFRLLRPLALPLAFLALMVPPPRFVLYELLFRMKLVVTMVSVRLLQAMGTTVLAEGNQVLVPGHTLFVSDACSGLTSIVTMLPIACVVAYFLTRGVWRRALVVASVFPLAMVANVVRVMLTVELVSVIGIQAAQGLLHESFGVATYAVGTVALVGVARLLR